jgi:anti-sigma B factor antagonist
MLAFNRADHGNVSTLTLAGRLTINTALELTGTVDQLVNERRTKVIIDMADLDLLDSSGVSMLMSLYRRVQVVGGQCQLINSKDQPLAILRLLEMDRVVLA